MKKLFKLGGALLIGIVLSFGSLSATPVFEAKFEDGAIPSGIAGSNVSGSWSSPLSVVAGGESLAYTANYPEATEGKYLAIKAAGGGGGNDAATGDAYALLISGLDLSGLSNCVLSFDQIMASYYVGGSVNPADIGKIKIEEAGTDGIFTELQVGNFPTQATWEKKTYTLKSSTTQVKFTLAFDPQGTPSGNSVVAYGLDNIVINEVKEVGSVEILAENFNTLTNRDELTGWTFKKLAKILVDPAAYPNATDGRYLAVKAVGGGNGNGANKDDAYALLISGLDLSGSSDATISFDQIVAPYYQGGPSLSDATQLAKIKVEEAGEDGAFTELQAAAYPTRLTWESKSYSLKSSTTQVKISISLDAEDQRGNIVFAYGLDNIVIEGNKPATFEAKFEDGLIPSNITGSNVTGEWTNPLSVEDGDHPAPHEIWIGDGTGVYQQGPPVPVPVAKDGKYLLSQMGDEKGKNRIIIISDLDFSAYTTVKFSYDEYLKVKVWAGRGEADGDADGASMVISEAGADGVFALVGESYIPTYDTWSSKEFALNTGTKKIKIELTAACADFILYAIDNLLITGTSGGEAPKLCPKPIDLTISDPTHKSIQLNWLAGTDENAAEIDSYVVGYSDVANHGWISMSKIYGLTELSTTIDELLENTLYYTIVKAVCGTDTSAATVKINETTKVACPKPENISTTGVGTNAFTLNWEAGVDGAGEAISKWIVEYRKKGEDRFIIADTCQLPTHPFTEMELAMVYEIRIQSYCPILDKTGEKTPTISVKTRCEAIAESELPFVEGFEGGETGTSNFLPACVISSAGEAEKASFETWKPSGNNSGWLWKMPKAGEKVLLMQATIGYAEGKPIPTKDSVYTSFIEMKNGHKYEMSAWYAAIGIRKSVSLEGFLTITPIIVNNEGTVVYSGTSINPSNTILDSVWQEIKFEFAPEEDNTYSFGFRLNSDKSTEDRVLLDNISVKRIFSCVDAEEIIASKITDEGASISWKEVADVKHQIRIGEKANFATTFVIHNVDANISEYALTELAGQTEYSYQVRVICSVGDSSGWSLAQQFTTLLACPAPSDILLTDATMQSLHLQFTAGRNETSWELAYNKGLKADTNTVVLIDKKDSVYTDLKSGSYHSFALRAVCGNKGKSVWVNKMAATLCADQYELPYVQDFEEMLSGEMPLCMTANKGLGSAIYPRTDGGDESGMASHSGQGYIKGINLDGHAVFTPKLVLKAGVSYKISAWFMGKTQGDPITFLYGKEDYIGEMDEISSDAAKKADVYQEASGTFVAAKNDTLFFAVKIGSTTTFSLDDLKIEEVVIPVCDPVKGIATTLITDSSAKISWTETSVMHLIKVGKSKDYASSTVAFHSVLAGTSNFVLKNLEAETEYSYQIQALCAEGDASEWSAVEKFTTLATPVPPVKDTCHAPFALVIDEITNTTMRFGFDAKEAQSEWDFSFVKGAKADTINFSRIEKTNALLSNLVKDTEYSFAVRAVCANSKSVWVSKSATTTNVSIEDTKSEDAVKVSYRNGNFLISNPNSEYIRYIEIYNAMGQQMARKNVAQNGDIEMACSLSEGIYMLKVQGKEFSKTVKLFVK